MADNFTITEGTGVTIGADEVTRGVSQKLQLVKIAYGVDGAYEGMASTSTPLPVEVRLSGSALITPYRNLDIDESGDVVVNSHAHLHSAQITNVSAGTRYLKVYNKATTPTSSDTPVLTIAIPTLHHIDISLPLSGLEFTNGIGLRATTGVADNDTGAPGTNDLIMFAVYST